MSRWRHWRFAHRVRGASNLRTLGAIAFWAVVGVATLWYFEPWKGGVPVAPQQARPAAAAAGARGPAGAAAQAPSARPGEAPPRIEVEADGRTGSESGVDMNVIEPDARLATLKVALARLAPDGKPEVLEDAAQVRMGDRLRIAIEAPEPVHVYAFNQEQGGAITVMFPIAGVDRGNPLPAGHNELPGTALGQSLSYTVAGRAPREEVLLVVALTAVPELESKQATLAAVARGDAAPDPGDAELGALGALASRLAASPLATQLVVFRWQLELQPP